MPQGRVLCAVALLVACVETGCAGRRQTTAAPELAPPPPTPASAPVQAGTAAVSNLRTAIDRIVSAPGLDRATWGIAVESLDRRDVLVSMNADRLLLPSSTMKIVTLAAAATRLGWDYVFETRLIASGRRAGGLLEGDLVVVGSGDPSLDDWDGAASRVFRDWARQLKDAGITTVTGRLVGDANVFDSNTLGAGWAWDDLDRSFATEVSGLQFNQNSAQLVIEPGPTVGDVATVTVNPPWAGLTVGEIGRAHV